MEYFASLVYRPDAEMVLGMIPYTGIYWTDEIPDDHDAIRALPEEDRWHVYRLLCIRKRIWRRWELSPADLAFWESARDLVPSCPVFQRLEVSRDSRRADRRVELQWSFCEIRFDREWEEESRQ